jgi:predicted  nucleic acid-binding Zn-ribbon protein
MSEDLILAALARLEGSHNEMRGEMSGMRGEITGIRGEMTDMRVEMSDMQSKLTDLHAGMADHGAKIDRLESGQSLMRSELTTLRVELMARMDRLQNTLTLVQDDITVNMGAADAAFRVNENTREDVRALREQVSVMWRQLKTVEAKVRQITGDA